MKNIKKVFCIFLVITLLLSFTISFNKKVVNASMLKLNKPRITLLAGRSINLNVFGTDKTVKWSTSEKKIAVVSQKGKVTGKNAGTAIVTAKAGKQKLQCKVTVKAALNKTTDVVVKNDYVELSLNGAVVKSFKSSNKKIAAVSQNGKVIGKHKGRVTITVVDNNGNKYKCKITVEEPSLDKKTVILQIKQNYILKLNGNTQKVSWSSDNKRVAYVDSEGKVTARSEGYAVITAKVGNKNFKCKIMVKAEEIPEVTETPIPTITIEPTETPIPEPTATPVPEPTATQTPKPVPNSPETEIL